MYKKNVEAKKMERVTLEKQGLPSIRTGLAHSDPADQHGGRREAGAKGI